MTRAGGIVGTANVFGYVRAMSSVPRGEPRGFSPRMTPLWRGSLVAGPNSVNGIVTAWPKRRSIVDRPETSRQSSLLPRGAAFVSRWGRCSCLPSPKLFIRARGAPVLAARPRVRVPAQRNNHPTLGAMRRLEGRRILQRFEVVFVRSVVDVRLGLELAATVFAILPAPCVALIPVETAERKPLMILKAAARSVGTTVAYLITADPLATTLGPRELPRLAAEATPSRTLAGRLRAGSRGSLVWLGFHSLHHLADHSRPSERDSITAASPAGKQKGHPKAALPRAEWMPGSLLQNRHLLSVCERAGDEFVEINAARHDLSSVVLTIPGDLVRSAVATLVDKLADAPPATS